jgi:hypothetical protein
VKVKQNVKPLIVFPGVKRTEFSMNLWWLNSYWYLVAGRSASCWDLGCYSHPWKWILQRSKKLTPSGVEDPDPNVKPHLQVVKYPNPGARERHPYEIQASDVYQGTEKRCLSSIMPSMVRWFDRPSFLGDMTESKLVARV